MHSHPYAKTPEEIAEWVRNMDEVGLEKTIILAMATGEKFFDIYRKYSLILAASSCGAVLTTRATTSPDSVPRPSRPWSGVMI
jgi:hypothetical protein